MILGDEFGFVLCGEISSPLGPLVREVGIPPALSKLCGGAHLGWRESLSWRLYLREITAKAKHRYFTLTNMSRNLKMEVDGAPTVAIPRLL